MQTPSNPYFHILTAHGSNKILTRHVSKTANATLVAKCIKYTQIEYNLVSYPDPPSTLVSFPDSPIQFGGGSGSETRVNYN